MKKQIVLGSVAITMALASSVASAAKFTVEVQNLTQGIHFTPLLVAAHDSETRLFEAGTAASSSLQAMAEGGSLDGLTADLAGTEAQYQANPAGGLLAPGATSTATTEISTHGTNNEYLSVVGMMLPTNDGFIGLNSYKIPTEAGTYTINLNAYDAGTEANAGGTGAAGADTNQTVHIHRGVLGDTDATGGVSDLDSRVHRWLNPVARVTITVQ